jgi:multiple sugar transport system substrate-binding protein
MKKLLIILITGLLILGGCPVKPFKIKGRKITLVWGIHRGVTETIEKLVESFEAKNPDIKVVVVEMPPSSSLQHYLYSNYFITKSSLIDVVTIDVIWTSEFAKKGWIIPLDDLLPEGFEDLFFSSAILSCLYKGKIYAVPLYTDAGVLYYREDILKRENLKPPDTWNELIEISNKLKEKYDIYGYLFQGANYEGLICNFFEMLWGNNGKIFNSEGELAIDSSKVIEVLKTLVNLVKEYKVVPEAVTTYLERESHEAFIEGKALFLRNWPYVWRVISKSELKGKVGVKSVLHFEGGESTPCLGGWNLAISSYSLKKEIAWKFIKYLTSEEAQKILLIEGGRLPARKSVHNDPELLNSPYYNKNFLEILKKAKPRPRLPIYAKISYVLQTEVHKVLVGEETPEEAVKNAEIELKELLSKNSGRK